MKHLLANEGRSALVDFAGHCPLLGFDFDGTLSPIVDIPARAELRRRTRALLHKVAARFDCVVLSGRARQDVCQRLGDIPVREVFGNHGLEPWHISESLFRQVKQWATMLTESLAGRPGVWIEDKGFSLSVHYRHCTDPRRTRKDVLAVLATLKGARILSGKLVYNVIPVGTIHKGTVFSAAMSFCRRDCAIYVGDDHTDEDVFAHCDRARLMGVHVGPNRRSRAAYYLRHQEEIDELLELLLRVPASSPNQAG